MTPISTTTTRRKERWLKVVTVQFIVIVVVVLVRDFETTKQYMTHLRLLVSLSSSTSTTKTTTTEATNIIIAANYTNSTQKKKTNNRNSTQSSIRGNIPEDYLVQGQFHDNKTQLQQPTQNNTNGGVSTTTTTTTKNENNHNQNDDDDNNNINITTPTTTTTTCPTHLWLVACETRPNNQHLIYWTFTAEQVQRLAMENDPTVSVHIINICDGLPKWKGFRTKKIAMKIFLKHVLIPSFQLNNNNDDNNNDNNGDNNNEDDTTSNNSSVQCQHNDNTLVLFSDSDAFFNPWATSARDAIERYRTALAGAAPAASSSDGSSSSSSSSSLSSSLLPNTNSKSSSSTGSGSSNNNNKNQKRVLISAEPICYIGSWCTQENIDEYYPNAVRSSCPQFVNSGAYMGPPDALLEIFEMDNLDQCLMKRRCDDQHQFTRWYVNNTHIATLDVTSSVFRSVGTGWLDARVDLDPSVSVRTQQTCGPGDAVRNCSQFLHPYWGVFNESSLMVEFPPLPDWMDCVADQYPFQFHGTQKKAGIRGKQLSAIQVLEEYIAGVQNKLNITFNDTMYHDEYSFPPNVNISEMIGTYFDYLLEMKEASENRTDKKYKNQK